LRHPYLPSYTYSQTRPSRRHLSAVGRQFQEEPQR